MEKITSELRFPRNEWRASGNRGEIRCGWWMRMGGYGGGSWWGGL